MSFEAFKRQENHVFCTIFKTIVTGSERFEMLYLVDIQHFRKMLMAVCFSCFSCYFECVHFHIFICNYLYIRYLYRYKKECIPHFFNWNNWNWTPGRVISTLPSLGLWTAFHEWVVSTAILLLKNKRCDFWVASLFLCTVWSHFYKDRLCPYINEW
jgi:hypothetical protein